LGFIEDCLIYIVANISVHVLYAFCATATSNDPQLLIVFKGTVGLWSTIVLHADIYAIMNIIDVNTRGSHAIKKTIPLKR
jgi:hypothetical protein